MTETRDLPVAYITADKRAQMRDAGTDEMRCMDYAADMRDGAVFPPLVVYHDGNHWWLSEGFHRLRAAVIYELEEVRAEVRKGGLRDAVLNAAGANADHGARRTNADKRRAVLTMLEDEEWSKWSDREIARQCRVSNDFVSKIRRSLSSDDSYDPAPRTYTTRHGTVATMDTSRIGRSDPEPQRQIEILDEPAFQRDEPVGDCVPVQQQPESPPSGGGSMAADSVNAFAQRAQETVAHVSHNSGNNEWYTPSHLLQAAREAMGGIDCDPATSEIANKTVGAETFYTADDDGLKQKWAGRVWMNPPYAQPLIAQFCDAMVEKHAAGEIDQACVLVNNATETAWFQELLSEANAVCLLRSRVKFLDPDGNPSGAPLQGQAVLYLGQYAELFESSFGAYGEVLVHP